MQRLSRPTITFLAFLTIVTGLAVWRIAPASGAPQPVLATGPAPASPMPTPAPGTDLDPTDVSADTERTDGIDLVTIADNEAGWVLLFGQSQWVDPECRWRLEDEGASFTEVAWDVLAPTSDITPPLTCDEIVDLWFAPFGVAPTDDTCTCPAPSAGNDPAPETDVPPAADGVDTTIPVGLRRGINFAGDFEVVPRGEWGTPIRAEWYALAAERGFDHVRLPIAWHAHNGDAPAFVLDEDFAAEVDEQIRLAEAAGLTIMINVHHFTDLDDSAAHEAEFLAIWRQLGERYAAAGDHVVFELLNEPVGRFVDDPDAWNRLAAEALTVVRTSNPTRTVVIGSVEWNHASRLGELVLPDDPNLVATFHTYDPSSFTHQGAVWADPVPPTGQIWDAGLRTIAFDWSEQSWSATVNPTADALTVAFDTTFAGFGLAGTGERYDTLHVTVDRPGDLVVLCNYVDGDPIEIPLSVDGTRARADVDACGGIDSLALQHVGAGTSTVSISRLGLCDAAGCDELVLTNAEALTELVAGAAEWAAAQGVPLYLGEFGVIDPPDGTRTDPASRIAWTRTVREAAEAHGVGWSVFDMSGSFPVYDVTAGSWDDDLVEALLG